MTQHPLEGEGTDGTCKVQSWCTPIAGKWIATDANPNSKLVASRVVTANTKQTTTKRGNGRLLRCLICDHQRPRRTHFNGPVHLHLLVWDCLESSFGF